MGKRTYSLKPIRYWYVYELDEICALLDVHIQTARKWTTKYGLRTIDAGKPILIYGQDLLDFLGKQNEMNKCALEFGQFYCVKCKEGKKPYQGKITVEQRSKNLVAKAVCQTCKSRMNKPFKLDDIPRIREDFNVSDVLELYDSDTSPSNTHLAAQNIKQKNEPRQQELFT